MDLDRYMPSNEEWGNDFEYEQILEFIEQQKGASRSGSPWQQVFVISTKRFSEEKLPVHLHYRVPVN